MSPKEVSSSTLMIVVDVFTWNTPSIERSQSHMSNPEHVSCIFEISTVILVIVRR